MTEPRVKAGVVLNPGDLVALNEFSEIVKADSVATPIGIVMDDQPNNKRSIRAMSKGYVGKPMWEWELPKLLYIEFPQVSLGSFQLPRFWVGLLHKDDSEVAAPNYARVAVIVDREKMNDNIQFPMAATDWGNVTSAAIYDSNSSSDPLAIINLSVGSSGIRVGPGVAVKLNLDVNVNDFKYTKGEDDTRVTTKQRNELKAKMSEARLRLKALIK